MRVDPDARAAAQALSTLEKANELPLAARTAYRFREPRDFTRRAAWDERLRRGSLEDLDASADAFADLAGAQPGDSSAHFNRGLSLAWAGNNIEAIASLERSVALDAEAAFDDAVSAWMLAEILRQGAGAESLSDDLRFNCTIGWNEEETATLLREFPEIRQVKKPVMPGALPGEERDIEVLEWLDRPSGVGPPEKLSGWGLPIVLATVISSRNSLRLSSPRPANLDRIAEVLFTRLEGGPQALRREAAPLPLAFLDADVWIFRLPPGIERNLTDELSREAIEHYFENEWIHRARKGLGDRTPREASLAVKRGDAIARVKLTAVVNLREQLGSRTSTRALYQGYPFDRLRRRLDLEDASTAGVDPLDLSCAPPHELDHLAPESLDDARLAEAAASAAGLMDDERTARFADEVLRRETNLARTVDLRSLVSALVRQAIARGDPEAALRKIEAARRTADAMTRATLQVWRAEILARQGRGDLALEVYQSLISPDASGAATALDGALSLIDNGLFDQAMPLLRQAQILARQTGLAWTERRAHQLES